MMNDQEMQFADPEWRPRQNGSPAAAGPELYIPEPINGDRPEQSQWQEPATERVYTAQEPPPVGADLAGTPPIDRPPQPQPQMLLGGQYGQVRPQRRRSIWPWIIAAFILFAIIGGSMGRFSSDRGPGMNREISAQPVPFDQTRQFPVQQQPTIRINGSFGSINIQSGNAAHEVFVHTDGSGANIAQTDSDTIQVSTDSSPSSSDISVDVTVPANANLVIQIDTGDVTVEGVSGQMSLTDTNGRIELHKVALTGNSTIHSDNDDITFQGSLDPNGTYQFSSIGGSVDLTLPSNSAFHVDATANNGSISSDFPSIQQSSHGNGSQAQGSVGNGPQATVTIKTDSGSISINGQ